MFVMEAQPIDKPQHLLVAPHPGRETLEDRAHLGRRGEVADIAVDAGGVGPIGFDRDNAEAMIDDQAPRDRGAGAVEFRRAVRRLAEQHDLGVTKSIEKRAEFVIALRRRQPLAMAAQ